MSLTLHVGQVVFLLKPRQMQVLPLQIVEETTKRSRHGEVVTYQAVSAHDLSTVVTLSSEDLASISTSLEDLRDKMIRNATAAVTTIVMQAGELARSSFSQVEQDVISESERSPIASPTAEDVHHVEMPDGSVARLRIPSVLP